MKFSASLIPDLEFLLLLTDFDKRPITFLKGKGCCCCAVRPAMSSTSALSIPLCTIPHEWSIESPHTWRYFALYRANTEKMNIKLFALTKSIISAIPERRLSHWCQRNEYGHVRHQRSLCSICLHLSHLLPTGNNNPHLQWTLSSRRKSWGAPSTSGPWPAYGPRPSRWWAGHSLRQPYFSVLPAFLRAADSWGLPSKP